MPGRRPFDGVDDAALERRIDLAARQDDGRGAQRIGDLGPRARCPQLEALEVIERAHRLARVHVDLVRVGAAGHPHHAELLHAPLAPHLDAAAGIDPVQQRLGRRRSDIAAEDRRGLVEAPVVAGPGMAGRRHLLLHRLGDLQRAADRSRGEDLELQLAAGQRIDLLGKALGKLLEMRAAGPRGGRSNGLLRAGCGGCKKHHRRCRSGNLGRWHVFLPQSFLVLLRGDWTHTQDFTHAGGPDCNLQTTLATKTTPQPGVTFQQSAVCSSPTERCRDRRRGSAARRAGSARRSGSRPAGPSATAAGPRSW